MLIRHPLTIHLSCQAQLEGKEGSIESHMRTSLKIGSPAAFPFRHFFQTRSPKPAKAAPSRHPTSTVTTTMAVIGSGLGGGGGGLECRGGVRRLGDGACLRSRRAGVLGLRIDGLDVDGIVHILDCSRLHWAPSPRLHPGIQPLSLTEIGRSNGPGRPFPNACAH